ncbi:hypothetical protein AURDEDRAFT_161013 [Auricularia subglabra TFB-10046 SS5]|nr:hypothetical protein AURDEDRAFT_161013 [Auricularia subglabra TFB-10046 SS5]
MFMLFCTRASGAASLGGQQLLGASLLGQLDHAALTVAVGELAAVTVRLRAVALLDSATLLDETFDARPFEPWSDMAPPTSHVDAAVLGFLDVALLHGATSLAKTFACIAPSAS